MVRREDATGLSDPASEKPLALVRDGVRTGAKQVLGGAKDSWETFCSLGPKDLLHPPLTTFRDVPLFRQFFQVRGFPTLSLTLALSLYLFSLCSLSSSSKSVML